MNFNQAQEKMQKVIEYFNKELSKVRGGRVNPQIIEDIKVNVYNSCLEIKQVGTVNVVNPTLITVQCWDKNNVDEVRKAIERSDLDVTVSVDGSLVRVQLPPLTEERRQELVKVIKKLAEEAKISLRRIRREFLDSQEEESLSEDDLERAKKDIQKVIDESNEEIDEAFERKKTELLTI